MLLTFNSTSAGHPLIKNANGTLRLGRWWLLTPDTQYFTSTYKTTAVNYSSSLVSGAVSGAKTAGSWTTRTATGGVFFDAFVATAFGEDYPYYDPAYQWAEGHCTIPLYSFTVPIALQSRTVRSVIVNVGGGGCTLLEFGAVAPDYVPYPLYVNPWTYSTGTCGFRFSTSKPSTPNSVGSAHTNVYFNALTSAAVTAGAPIVYDSSGYWTCFNGGQVNINTPATVNSICQGASKIWLCAWPTSVPAFSIPSDYSKAEHAQNARTGIPYLWIYA